jgi:tRNA threonylcarbamoyladenosine biosynthesis protein TsaE
MPIPMLPPSTLELDLADADATAALGAALARTLPGNAALVLHLKGELGAGKTTCARSVLRELGVTGLIRSPTYTLVETYRVGALTCVHVDLYRLQGPADVAELGLREYLEPESLMMIEWPDRGGAQAPPADLELTLSYADLARRGRLLAASALGGKWLTDLRSTRKFDPAIS